jgi:hypothetical protein
MEINSMNRLYKYLLCVFIISVSIGSLVYFLPHNMSDYDAYNRNLDGTVRHLLNGRLGYFFNLKYIGISAIACLILLTQINFKTISRSTLFSLVLILLVGVFLSFYAYINYRYISTLLPLMIGLMITLSSNLLNNKEQKTWFSSLLLIQIIIFALVISFSFYPKYKSRLVNTAVISSPKNLVQCPNIYHFINDSIGRECKFLINNLPEFYVYTKHYGVFYWSGDDEYFNNKGTFNLLKNKSNEQVMRYIKDSLNLKFVLTNQQLTPYNNRFNLILKDYFKLRKKDQLGNELYELL